MNLESERQSWRVSLRPRDGALLEAPDWAELSELERRGVVFITLDMDGVDFVSTGFLEGCAALAREAEQRGQRFVMMHLTPHQEKLLGLIDGGDRITVLQGEDELAREAASLVPADTRNAPAEGVSNAEKIVLWSKPDAPGN